MNTHKHARLTYARRLEMVKQMTERGLSATEAALLQRVTPATARKWLGRYLVQGLDNQEPEYNFSYPATPDMFSPQALRTRGIQ